MNKLSETLTKIFNPEVIVDYTQFEEGNKIKYQITLIEEDNLDKKNTLSKITLIGFNEIFLAIKFDKLPFLHGRKDSIEKIENSLLIAENIRKSCDYIVWAEFEGQKIILLIELKSKNNDEVPDKFRSSKAFIAYIKSLLQEFYNFSIENYEIIPLLLNVKANKIIRKVDNSYFCKGFHEKKTEKQKVHNEIKTRKLYYIKHDFEKILNK
jgi:hypothetical protein